LARSSDIHSSTRWQLCGDTRCEGAATQSPRSNLKTLAGETADDVKADATEPKCEPYALTSFVCSCAFSPALVWPENVPHNGWVGQANETAAKGCTQEATVDHLIYTFSGDHDAKRSYFAVRYIVCGLEQSTERYPLRDCQTSSVYARVPAAEKGSGKNLAASPARVTHEHATNTSSPS